MMQSRIKILMGSGQSPARVRVDARFMFIFINDNGERR